MGKVFPVRLENGNPLSWANFDYFALRKMEYYCDINRHLVCKPFSINNLHKMAKELDIKKCWYHGGKHPHYDIPKKRIEEIKNKCIIISDKEIYVIIHENGKYK